MKESNFYRACPECNKTIYYGSKYSLKFSMKNHTRCRSCSNYFRGRHQTGEQNPFYGKNHSEQSKKLSGEKIRIYYTTEASKDFKKKAGERLKKYGNHDHPYKIWIKKYGKEIADEKMQSIKEKYSRRFSGSLNPMYGKPAPQGSGNGWSGWYKEWFFRSLGELSYMINVIEKNNWKWESAERKDLKISYEDYKGTIRNYFPDFLIGGKTLIECKPKNLWNSRDVVLKREAAEKYCQEREWVFQLVEPIKLSKEEIVNLHKSGDLKFMERYEVKFNAYHRD